jgi:hypothetical protein
MAIVGVLMRLVATRGMETDGRSFCVTHLGERKAGGAWVQGME